MAMAVVVTATVVVEMAEVAMATVAGQRARSSSSHLLGMTNNMKHESIGQTAERTVDARMHTRQRAMERLTHGAHAHRPSFDPRFRTQQSGLVLSQMPSQSLQVGGMW